MCFCLVVNLKSKQTFFRTPQEHGAGVVVLVGPAAAMLHMKRPPVLLVDLRTTRRLLATVEREKVPLPQYTCASLSVASPVRETLTRSTLQSGDCNETIHTNRKNRKFVNIQLRSRTVSAGKCSVAEDVFDVPRGC